MDENVAETPGKTIERVSSKIPPLKAESYDFRVEMPKCICTIEEYKEEQK